MSGVIPILRRASADDAATLAALKLDTYRETFIEGFAIPYPPTDLALFEKASYGLATVSAELADPTHATWVLDAGGALVGYAHVGPCKLPYPSATPDEGELYQLYVRKTAQGGGHGRRLLDQALAHLSQTWRGSQWLGVWSGNARAQAIYHAHGFTKVGEYGFAVGSWIDREFILRRA